MSAYKRCTVCGIEKHENDFHKGGTHTDGMQHACKGCTGEYNKRYRKSNREICRDVNRRNKYGVDYLDVLFLLKGQDYKCPICGRPVTESDHLDHNHWTGKVRGILHAKCNQLLGHCGEDIAILDALLTYLRKHNQ